MAAHEVQVDGVLPSSGGDEDASSALDPLCVFSFAVLIIGGTLMLVGSCEPWAYSGVSNGVIVHRSGLQLGSNNSFSPAGIPAIVAGSVAVLDGALLLARRRVPRLFDLPWILFGLVGVATGLYGLGEARWYTEQATFGYPRLFFGGASYGIWLVLVGGIGTLFVALLQIPVSRRLSLMIGGAGGLAALGAGLLLAPRL